MARFIVVMVVAVVIEALQMILIKDSYFKGKPDPDAIKVTAYKNHEPRINYIPGSHDYDEKHKRYVTLWEYCWEYKGKKHTIRCSDDPNNQHQWLEHYMPTFPEEAQVTINKNTGKYYMPKNVRAQSRKYFLSLIISLVISYFITGIFFGG